MAGPFRVMNHVRPRRPARLALMMAGAALPLLAGAAHAQTAPAQSTDQVEEVVVTGIRATLRNSVELKRNTTAIVDALAPGEIGDIPALSISEAIETITGAASHRLKGSGSEISIRGLGPFLGFSTFNGREVTNGSGDRSVNFQQFPSELVNQVIVYKSQQADLVEGGTSGVTELRSLRPLDYGKRRIVVEGKLNYNPTLDRLHKENGLGYRGSISYVNKWKVGGGDLGLSLGYQRFDSSNPEESYLPSSTIQACDGRIASPSGDCAQLKQPQLAADPTIPFYLVSNSLTYRSQNENEYRDAAIAHVQWRPTPKLEVNLDYEWSGKRYIEDRHDLILTDGKRQLTNRVVDEEGALLSYDGVSRLEAQNLIRRRAEEYNGGGFGLAYDFSDRLRVSTDLSFSKTHRNEQDFQTRLQTGPTDVNGASTGLSSGRVAYHFNAVGLRVPEITFQPGFDPNNADLFSANAYARRPMSDRRDEAKAARIDLDYDVRGDFVTKIDAGVRLGEHKRLADLSNTNNIESFTAAQAIAANKACRIPFIQKDWMSSEAGKNVGGSWATFDGSCMYHFLTGVADRGPAADPRSTDDVDVTERTQAAYVMANFDTEAGGRRLHGNFGVRAVKTNVKSVGYRSAFKVVNNTDGTVSLAPVPGTLETQTIKADYTRVLPSVNVIYDLKDNLLLRGAIYKAMTRFNIEDLDAGRTFPAFKGTERFTTVEQALSTGVSGGSPGLEPLDSWNYDLSLEWYVSKDTTVSLAAYYKQFQGSSQPAIFDEPFVIDGVTVTVPVSQRIKDDDKSGLHGVELTAQSRFSFLPAPLDGLGGKASVNWAETDFQSIDPVLGEQHNATTGQTYPGFVPPASIFGFSKWVISGTLYWEQGPLRLAATYKYRSRYFQPTAGASANRFVEDFNYVDLTASYDIRKNLEAKLEVQNIFDEPQDMSRPVRNMNGLLSSTGPKVFLGLKATF